MKNKRAIIMMAVAVLFGLAAVLLAKVLLLPNSGSTGSQIVVAAADINLGQRLRPDLLKLAEWPARSLPPDAVRDPQKLTGRVLKSSMFPGEPVTEAKLAPEGTLGGLSAVIVEGKRAITVRVNDVIGVAGFALPGNFVDIIVNTQKDAVAAGRDPREQTISKIVLERILVLAVAQEVSRDDTKPRVVNAVTLEVTPDQAENLDLARSVGTLSLVLRNQVDPKAGATEGATKHTLLAEAVPPKPAPVRKPAAARKAVQQQRNCVAVIDGLRTSQECF
jgi:pilus assembly protein CpaB